MYNVAFMLTNIQKTFQVPTIWIKETETKPLNCEQSAIKNNGMNLYLMWKALKAILSEKQILKKFEIYFIHAYM